MFLYSAFSLLSQYVVKSGVYHSVIHIIAMTMSYFYLIDVLFILFNKKKRAMHDYIAGSYVVTQESLLKTNDININKLND
jgi:uncharacterized RDD family membrane protein YckC